MMLPQLTAGRRYLTDGGLETTLVFHQGLDLPDFAAFPLLDTEEGRGSIFTLTLPVGEASELAWVEPPEGQRTSPWPSPWPRTGAR